MKTGNLNLFTLVLFCIPLALAAIPAHALSEPPINVCLPRPAFDCSTAKQRLHDLFLSDEPSTSSIHMKRESRTDFLSELSFSGCRSDDIASTLWEVLQEMHRDPSLREASLDDGDLRPRVILRLLDIASDREYYVSKLLGVEDDQEFLIQAYFTCFWFKILNETLLESYDQTILFDRLRGLLSADNVDEFWVWSFVLVKSENPAYMEFLTKFINNIQYSRKVTSNEIEPLWRLVRDTELEDALISTVFSERFQVVLGEKELEKFVDILENGR